MTSLRWLAALGLVAALALAFLSVPGSSLEEEDLLPQATSKAPGRNPDASETLVSLEELAEQDDSRSEVSAPAALADAVGGGPASALQSSELATIRIQLVGPGAKHPEAVLGENFQVFGAEDSFAGAKRVAATPDGDGTFVLKGVQPGEIRWVGLDARLFIDALMPVPAVEAGQTRTVELMTARGVGASGVVVDADGAPVPGARVRLGSWERGDLFSSIGYDEATETGADGSFLVGGVLPGEMTLRVSCDGYTPGKQELGSYQEGDLIDGVEIALTGGGVISGVVVWPDGAPAEKASVRMAQVGRSWANAPTVKTDEAGAFEFTGLRGSSFRVIVSAKKKRSRARWRAEGLAAIGQQLRLELGAGLSLLGTVSNDLGEPLSDFRVTATPVGMDEGGDPASVRERKGDGTFELAGLASGAYDVVVTAKGHTSPQPARVRLPGGEARVDAVLPRHASVEGLVQDPAGEPLAGVGLRVGGRAVSSDEDGTFRVEDVDAGSLRVTLAAGTPGVLRSGTAVLEPGESNEGLVVVIAQGATVRCELHPSLEGGIHSAATLRRENTYSMPRATFDEEGVAVFAGLEAGTYWAALPPVAGREWADTHRETQQVPVEVAENATATVVVGDPNAYSKRVSGQVTRAGELQSALLMYIYQAGPEKTFPAAIARTDDDGRFEVRLRSSGEYTFNIGEGQRAQARFVVQVSEASEQRHDFELPDKTLSGRATFADGTPVVGRGYVLVHADAPNDTKQAGDLQFAATKSDGTFRFTGLHPGRYRLHTGNYFTEHDTDGLLIIEDIVVAEAGETPVVELTIPQAATLVVRAVAGDDTPLGSYGVTLETPSGLPHHFYPSATTDSFGYQRVRGVGPGAWVVVVREPGGSAVAREAVQIIEGEVKEVTVVCPL